MGRRRVVAALVGGVVVLAVAYPAPVIGAGALATRSDVAPFEDLFVGVGEALVLDSGSGTSCTATFLLYLDESARGRQALLRFLPVCQAGSPLNSWQVHWALHPFAYELQGDWDTGFTGDSQLLLFKAHLEIGPHEDGIDIPASGSIAAPVGPLEVLWSGTISDTAARD